MDSNQFIDFVLLLSGLNPLNPGNGTETFRFWGSDRLLKVSTH